VKYRYFTCAAFLFLYTWWRFHKEGNSVACDSLRENQICYIGSPQRTAKLIDEYPLKYETVTMQYFNKLMALVFLLGFYFSRTAVAQDSTVVPSKFWVISRMMKRQSKVYMGKVKYT